MSSTPTETLSKATLPSTSRARSVLTFGLGLLLLISPGPILTDEPSNDIIRIEEDWELQIGLPDPNTNGPQVQNTLSPGGDHNDQFAVFEINHATQPSYRRGGMQLQSWSYNSVGQSRDFEAGTMLDREDEVIRYTLAMEIENGRLQFSLNNGSSDTWGEFGLQDGNGDPESNSVSVSTNRSSLNSYQTDTSVENSGVNYASHRVKCLAIREVRYYSSSGLVRRDTTERVVHSSGEAE